MSEVMVMAKKQAKPKAAQPEGTTRALRMSQEYAAWLEALAKRDSRTVASLMEHAIRQYAESIGFSEPPERV